MPENTHIEMCEQEYSICMSTYIWTYVWVLIEIFQKGKQVFEWTIKDINYNVNRYTTSH